jgi:two-component system sensor histidine kinase UhpB
MMGQNNSGTNLRVLCVEDSEGDAWLLERELIKGGYNPLLKRVDSPGTMNEALRAQTWDLVLADWNLPRFTALFALEMLKCNRLDLPFIIVSGTIGEEAAIEAMRAGAHDYVMKSNLGRLIPVIQRELREADDRRGRQGAEKAVAAAENRLRLVARATNDAIWDWDLSAQTLDWSEGFQSLFGVHPHELPTGVESWYERLNPNERERVIATRYAVINGVGETWSDQYGFRRVDGTYAHVLDRGYVLRNEEGRVVRAIGALTDLTKQKEAETAIAAAYERLRNLMLQLEHTREDERKRIARELHDEFGQLLTGLKLDLSWLSKQVAKEAVALPTPVMDKLKAMTGLVDDSIQLVRRVAADLRPSILDDLGLIPALQWQAREFEARAGFPCETELASDLVQRNLDSDRSSALFRIAQELLTNVMRHARASRARLLLREESNGWLLEVSDNGRGIVAKDYVNPTTLGLRGMQERVALFGGTLEFRGEPEKGTTVRVWIPQQNDHAEVADRKAA